MKLAVDQMTTQRQWADIILHPSALDQLGQLRSWLQENQLAIDGEKRLAAGYRVLFFGPAGTGKSLTASVLATEAGMDIYRIDLSTLVSKYIGETEKNLSVLFEKGESKGWVLFFDEADALFGKRTDVKDAHDKYANLETDYLLQRIENYKGLVILATNRKEAIDEAFLRRIQSIIYFPLPTQPLRKRIWESGLLENQLLLEKTDIEGIAEQYELSPAAIMKAILLVKKETPAGISPVPGRKIIEAIGKDVVEK